MKFAKTLAAQLHAPWHDSYFPYKQLKKQLGALKGGGRSKFAGVEGAFYASVVHSIQMVDEFYGVQEEGLLARLSALAAKLRELGAAVAAGGGAPSSSSPPAERQAILEAFASIVDEARRLQKYSQLNRTAVVKILKKHDKQSPIRLSASVRARLRSPARPPRPPSRSPRLAPSTRPPDAAPAAQLSEYADGHRFCSLAKLDAILSHAEALLAALLADASVAALPALPPLLAGAAPYSTPETAAAAAPPLSGMTAMRTAAAHPTAAAAALLAPYRSDGRETSNSDDATGPAHARPAHAGLFVPVNVASLGLGFSSDHSQRSTDGGSDVDGGMPPPPRAAAAAGGAVSAAQRALHEATAAIESVSSHAAGGVPPPPVRTRACVECRRAKAACQGDPCARCLRLGKQCVTEERKRRRTHANAGRAPTPTAPPSADVSRLTAAAAATSLLGCGGDGGGAHDPRGGHHPPPPAGHAEAARAAAAAEAHAAAQAAEAHAAASFAEAATYAAYYGASGGYGGGYGGGYYAHPAAYSAPAPPPPPPPPPQDASAPLDVLSAVAAAASGS